MKNSNSEKRFNPLSRLVDTRLKTVIGALIFTLAMAYVLQYFLFIPINLAAHDAWGYLVGIGVIAILNSLWLNGFRCMIERKKTGRGYIYCDNIKDFSQKYTAPFFYILVVVGIILIWVVLGIASSPMANAIKYSELITVEDGNFEEDIIEVTSENIVVVDVKSAQRLGDRAAGTIPNASWYEIDDEYNLISINGEEYRISPVNYKDLWTYFKGKEIGIPGYILVNAKTQETEFVTLEENMKYSPSAKFSYKLQRHLFNQFPTYIFGKSFFEVDDEGNPYWITAIKEAQIGLLGGKMDVGAVITDAVTGESTEYAIDDLPEWVDHVSSVDDLMTLVGYHYRYSEGFLNFSNTNVFKTSYSYKSSQNSEEENSFTPFEGYNTVLSKGGEIFFYTGITPPNSTESNIGFVLVNPKTAQVTFYDFTGAEESSAQIAAEGLVQDLKYSASFPTIVNVDGIATYFMVLKDNAGLIQRYSLCNLENYSKCVEDSTLEGAIRKYKEKLGMSVVEENAVSEPIAEERTVITGVVSEVKEAQIGGYTYYYFRLLNSDETVFMSSIQNSNQQPLSLVEGSNVTVEYYASSEASIAIVTRIEFE